MKLFILSLALLSTTLIKAQSPRYEAVMTANIAAIDSSFSSPEKLLALANTFERIAVAEKTQWLPYYYAAFLQVNYGFMNQDKSKTDLIADKAASLVESADKLSPANSELSVIKSMIASCKLMVDPMSRYMQYGAESNTHLENAKREDVTNPRPYVIKAQGLRYTPEQFGGGCEAASAELKTALDKFNSFKPTSSFHPNWGKEMAEKLLAGCK